MKKVKSAEMTQAEVKAKSKAEEAEEARAIGTLEKGSFKELVDSYETTYRKRDQYGREYVGDKKTKTVLMNAPVDVFYNKTNNMGDPFQKIPLNELPRTDTDPEVCHGITLRQLDGVWANVERRCEEEHWKNRNGKHLTPQTVNLHDVKKYVVMPFTEQTRQSFVATLPSTGTYQIPRIFVSASFNLPIRELIACLAAFINDFHTNFSAEHNRRGGGMTENTPVWLVGFARNQWDLPSYPDDPMETPMAKAINVAEKRVLSITDKDGQYFSRAWPAFESYLAMKHRLWYVYTANDGDNGAVGLISGGATSDIHAVDTLTREKSFPTSLIVKCIKQDLKKVTAEKEADCKHVLNTILGMTDIDAKPPTTDSNYDASYNDNFRAHFVTPGTLQAALLLNDGSWQSMLKVMSKGHMSMMRFDFAEGRGWDGITDADAVELIKHLPHTIDILELRCGNFNSQFIHALGDWIELSKVTTLLLTDTLVNSYVDNDSIKYFAKALQKNKSLTNIQVWRVNQENEHKVWKEDVNIIEILAQSEHVANALFASLDEIYADSNPNFSKISFLLTLFMRINRSFPKHVTCVQSKLTLDWVQGLSEPSRAALFQSQAGSFVKTILNRKFTWPQNLAIVMLDLYIQLIIVVLLSTMNYKNGATQDGFVQPLLTICCAWISFRELMQMGGTYTKIYIKEASNWVDLTQIALLYIIIFSLNGEPSKSIDTGTLFPGAICMSWVALIFDLGNFVFQLATFVTGVVRIIRGLVPFMFTALLLTLMFAHAFRARYADDGCNMTEKGDLVAADEWNCLSLGQSYEKAIEMFLSSELWVFDERGRVLTWLYAFFMGVILLNMIISIVGNILTEVQHDAKNAFWDNRLSVTTEIDSFWSLFPFLGKYLRKRFVFQKDPRINFLYGLSQEVDVELKKSDPFFDWWFAPLIWGVPCPDLLVRLKAFYLYSLWDDIIYPGVVLERVVLGLNHNAELATAENDDELGQRLRSTVSRAIVKIFLWCLLIVHIMIMLIVFICGLFFGITWPQAMTRHLFHVSTDPDMGEIKELSLENDKLKEELRKDYYKLRRDIEEQKSGYKELSRDIIIQVEKLVEDRINQMDSSAIKEEQKVDTRN